MYAIYALVFKCGVAHHTLVTNSTIALFFSGCLVSSKIVLYLADTLHTCNNVSYCLVLDEVSIISYTDNKLILPGIWPAIDTICQGAGWNWRIDYRRHRLFNSLIIVNIYVAFAIHSPLEIGTNTFNLSRNIQVCKYIFITLSVRYLIMFHEYRCD